MTIATLCLLLAIPMHSLRVDRQTPRDSVRVLLFASHSIDRVVITVVRGESVEIEADDTELRIRGEHRDSVVFGPQDHSVISIATGFATRRIRGRVVVTAADGRLWVVATISMNDYLSGTLAAETFARDPMEYLTALSVLQRNYARRHRSRHAPRAELCDNTHCQRTDMGLSTPRLRAAVDRSRWISVDEDPCYYSVNCGGRTLTPVQVWGRYEPGYQSVRCEYCRGSRWRRWGRSVRSSPEIDQLLASLRSFPAVNEGVKIAIGRLAGFGVVPGNTFDRVERRGNVWRIYGRGFGHRVGLCQEGAKRMAEQGRRAADILDHYMAGPIMDESEQRPGSDQ